MAKITISELITKLEELKAEHGDIPVMVDGYEDGFNSPSAIGVVDVAKNDSEYSWNGAYSEAKWVVLPVPTDVFPVVVLSR